MISGMMKLHSVFAENFGISVRVIVLLSYSWMARPQMSTFQCNNAISTVRRHCLSSSTEPKSRVSQFTAGDLVHNFGILKHVAPVLLFKVERTTLL